MYLKKYQLENFMNHKDVIIIIIEFIKTDSTDNRSWIVVPKHQHHIKLIQENGVFIVQMIV
jgi:hypothetical protein